MNNEENKERKMEVAAKLPDLSVEEKADAIKETSQNWLRSILTLRRGDFWQEGYDHGVEIQIVSEDTIRCTRIFEDASCYWYLSMIGATCESLGVNLELEPYTLVIPIPSENQMHEEIVSKQENHGVEVA